MKGTGLVVWAVCGTAGYGIDQHFGVAVVGGDEHGAALGADGRLDAAETGVNGFYCFNCRFDFAGVAHHIGVGEVHDNYVEGSVFNCLHYGVGDTGGAHLGFQIVGRDFGRGHEQAFFAGERLFDASVEEVGDVGIFFGFGHAQVAEIHLAHHIGENVVHRLRRDDDGQAELFVIASHANVVQILGYAVAWDGGVEIVGAG